MKMTAAVTWGVNEPFSLEEVELAAPRDDEILVKIAACGVCHTDEAAKTQAIPVPLPAVLGHEGSGPGCFTSGATPTNSTCTKTGT